VEAYEVDISMMANGILSDAFRVKKIKYAVQTAGKQVDSFPKCAKADPQVVTLCQESDAYAKELYFYENRAHTIGDAIGSHTATESFMTPMKSSRLASILCLRTSAKRIGSWWSSLTILWTTATCAP
jgi:hypothetical protein